MVDKRFDPVDLDYFVTIVTMGSLGAASAELGVSQPGLSKCVHRLERLVGVPLLIRSSRGVSPTSMGEHLLHRAQHILAELDGAKRSLRELAGGGVGRVSIGVSPSLAFDLIPALCAVAQSQRPMLTIQVVEGLYEDLLIGLRQGRLDLILTTPPSDAPPVEVAVEQLGFDVFAAFASSIHPLVRTHGVYVNAFLKHSWVLAPAVGALRERFCSMFERQGLVSPIPYVETFSINCCRSLIADHNFLSFLPSGVLRDDVAQNRVAEIPLPWLRWERRLCLLSLEQRNLPPAALYVQQLVKEVSATHLRQTSAEAGTAPLGRSVHSAKADA